MPRKKISDNEEKPWSQKHECPVCHDKWECFLVMCWEPYWTKCGIDGKCKMAPLVCGFREDFELKS